MRKDTFFAHFPCLLREIMQEGGIRTILKVPDVSIAQFWRFVPLFLRQHIEINIIINIVIWDSYWLILWCQNTHIDSYCGVKSPFLSDLRLILWCQKSISEWFENPVNLGLKKELGLPPPPASGQCHLFLPFFFMRASLNWKFWNDVRQNDKHTDRTSTYRLDPSENMGYSCSSR